MPTAVKMPCHASVIGPMCTLGSKGSSITGLAPVTFLEFLSRATPAGIVPAELPLCGTGRRTSVAARARGRRRPRARLGLLALTFLRLLGLLGGPHGHPQDRLGHTAGDAGGHLLEEAVRFALVGDEGVLLSIAPQVDALTELLHRGEVLDPVRVDRAEEHPSLDDSGKLLAQLLLARLVRLVDELGDPLAERFLSVDPGEARRGQLGPVEHRFEGG